MRRYVREFANDILTQNRKNSLMKPEVKRQIADKIFAIIGAHLRGMITSFEAIKSIIALMED